MRFLSLMAKASYLDLSWQLFHLAPSSLATSGTFQVGLASVTDERSSLEKNIKAESARFGALGSFAFLPFFSTLPLDTFFKGEASGVDLDLDVFFDEGLSETGDFLDFFSG